MADKKISQLSDAATPLAGTEVLPIVQSGSTVKVSVNNLTAGKAVSASSVALSGNLTTSAGNVGIGTTSPTNALSFGGNSARTAWMERHTTADTAGNNLTIQSGGAASGATNKNGGNLVLSSGTATGSGSSSIRFFTATAGGSGTADSAPTQKALIDGDGNFVVGATSGTSRLTVETDTNANAGAFVRNQNTGASASGQVTVATLAGNLIVRTHSAAHSVWPSRGLISTDSGLTNGLALLTSGSTPMEFWTNSTRRVTITGAGSMVVSNAALATNATDGFLYVPGCAGTPTGVPTAFTGRVPIVVDTTNNKLYFYSGAAWRDAGP